MRDGVRLDAPAIAGVPARVERPAGAVLVVDVRDVRVAVDEQSAFLSLSLLFEQFPELGEVRLGCFSEFAHDGRVDGVLLQLLDAERRRSDALFHEAEEVGLEVLADPVDLHAVDGFAFAELVAGDELVNADNVDRGDGLEKRGLGSRRNRSLFGTREFRVAGLDEGDVVRACRAILHGHQQFLEAHAGVQHDAEILRRRVEDTGIWVCDV